MGVVAVPDERLEKLAVFSRSAKITPTVIEFVDIAGLVRRREPKAKGWVINFSHIRETKAIAQVVRVFERQYYHVEKRVDPLGDVEIINLELICRPLATVAKRLEQTSKEAKSGVNKEAVARKATLEKMKTALESSTLLNAIPSLKRKCLL